jgi:RNA polymerase sigma-54 factor
MALSAKLELRQSQQLVMTPQLQQAIKLLQLSNVELSTFVDAELERNPLLERDDEDADDPVRASAIERDASPTQVTPVREGLDLMQQSGAAAADLDTDIDNVFPDTPPSDLGYEFSGTNWASVRTRTHNIEGDANLEATIGRETSLKDYLSEQLQLALTDPAERLIGAYNVDQVVEAG